MNQWSVAVLPSKLSLRNLFWSVGFLEGEGCFSKNKTSQSVSVYQSGSTETLLKLQELFGGVISKKPASGTSKFIRSRLQRYEWRCYGASARNVMQQVYPHMSIRRKAKILEVLNVTRDGRKICKRLK